MFETTVTVIFFLLVAGILWLSLQITRGLIQSGVLVLLMLVLPLLVRGFLMASGMFLLMPVGLLLMAFGLVKACM